MICRWQQFLEVALTKTTQKVFELLWDEVLTFFGRQKKRNRIKERNIYFALLKMHS
jgi:hypothetical protein